MRRSEDVLDVFWTSYFCSVYVLSPGGSRNQIFTKSFFYRDIAVLNKGTVNRAVTSFWITICDCDLWFLFRICYSRQLSRQNICHHRTSSSKCRLNLFLCFFFLICTCRKYLSPIFSNMIQLKLHLKTSCIKKNTPRWHPPSMASFWCLYC